jgi:hypothetical protein
VLFKRSNDFGDVFSNFCCDAHETRFYGFCMPKYTCAFVEQDKETLVQGVNVRQFEADSLKDAAIIFKGNRSFGPYIRVRDEDGHQQFFKVSDYEAGEEAIAAREEQIEAKQASQSSLLSTDILLKELITKTEEIRVIAKWFWWWFIGISLICMVLLVLVLLGAIAVRA